MLIQPEVHSVLMPKVYSKLVGEGAPLWVYGGTGGTAGPPVYDKLLVWLNGDEIAGEGEEETYKVDSISGYNFLVSTEAVGVDLSPEDYDSIPEYDEAVAYAGAASTWGGGYKAPDWGFLGYTELTAIDIGTHNFLYVGGEPDEPVERTQVDYEAIDNDQYFFCEAHGLLIYDEVLTGDELFYVLEYCGKAESVTVDGVVVTNNGEIVYTRI